jgi:hypothetical protein
MARRKVDTARGVRGTRRRNTGNNNGQTKSDPALNEALGKAAAHSLMTNDDSLQQILGRTLRENGMTPNDVFNNRGGMNRYQPVFDNWGSPPDTGAGVGGRTLQNGGPNQTGLNPNLPSWVQNHITGNPADDPNMHSGRGHQFVNPGGLIEVGQNNTVGPGGGTAHNHGGTRHDHPGGGPGHKHDGGGGNPDPNWNPGFTGDPAARFQARSPVPTGQRAENLQDRFSNYGQYVNNFQNRIPSGPNGSDYGIYAIPPISRDEWQQMVNGTGPLPAVGPNGRPGGGQGGGGGGQQVNPGGPMQRGGGGGQNPTFDPSQFQRGDTRPYDPSQLLGNGNNAYTPDMTNQQVRAQWGPQGFGLNGQPGYQNAYGQPQTQPMQGGGGQPTPHSHGGQPHAHPQGDQPHGHGQGGQGGGGGGQGGQAGGGGQGGGAGGGGQDGGPWATQNPDGTWSYPSPDAHMPGTNFTPVPGAGTPMTSEPASLTTPPPGSYPWGGKGYMAPPSNMTYYNPGVGGFSGLQAPSSAPVSFATADQLAQQYGLALSPGAPPNQLPNPSGGTQPGWANPAPPGPDMYDPWIESRLIGNAYKPTAGNLGGFTQAYLQAAGGDNAYTRLALQQYLAHKAGYQGYGTMTDALPYGYVAPHG